MFALRIRPLAAATVAAVGATVALAGSAVAGQTVDLSTLNPVPSGDTTCSEDGAWIICHRSYSEPQVDAFPLPCGMVYVTGVDAYRVIRWYDADTRTIVKRFVAQDSATTWSLSPDGSGPTVNGSSHGTKWNREIVGGDIASAPEVDHGEVTLSAPGYGVIWHEAGYFATDGPVFHGTSRFDDPSLELCPALGG